MYAWVPGGGEPGQSGTRLPGYAGDRPVVGDLRNGVPRCSHVSVPSPRRRDARSRGEPRRHGRAVAGPAAAEPRRRTPRSRSTPSRRPPVPTPAPAASSATPSRAASSATRSTVRDLSVPAVAAHIHEAPRHVAGPVVIPLPAVPSATTVARRPRASSGRRGVWSRPPGEPARRTTSTSTRRRSPAERSAARSRVTALPPGTGQAGRDFHLLLRGRSHRPGASTRGQASATRSR